MGKVIMSPRNSGSNERVVSRFLSSRPARRSRALIQIKPLMRSLGSLVRLEKGAWPTSIAGAEGSDMQDDNNAGHRGRGSIRELTAAATAAAGLALISLPAASAELGDVRRGHAYATAVCAQCHAVAPEDMTSPRPEATPFTTISRLPGINDRALGVFLQTTHGEMPNLVVTGQDRDDLIAYILSLRGTP
jgi:mono/diheme cytochrome c family protein